MSDDSLGDADYYRLEDYAGFGTRILVVLLDAVALLALAVLLWLPFLVLILAGAIQRDPSGNYWIAMLILTWCYLTVVKRKGKTLSYWILKLRIVNAKGGEPSIAVMTGRMMLWLLGPFNVVLDLLWLGADTERQSLRDSYMGTYVIKRDAKPIGRATLSLARYYSCGFAFAYPRVNRPRSDV
ncbi:MAG TPA: RDD family protein [Planctomycetaceae bacterium]|nr:RDD family protein [Planctomycetaceae bacterium]